MKHIDEIFLALPVDGSVIRFTEILGGIKDVTPKQLSACLKRLVRLGLVNHSIDASNIPIKSFYSLSQKGKRARSIVARYVALFGGIAYDD